MGFFEELEKLRARPEGERKKILAGAVLAIMALVTALWVQNLNFGRKEGLGTGSAPKASARAEPAPWDVLRETFRGSFEDLKNSLKLNQQ
ncbi:MAG TPA: hypothetical protein VJL09_00395 [Candidatus Paceibacterota bacterium]